MIIDGKRIAADVIADLKLFPRPKKILVAIVARTDAATVSFIREKERVARELGIDFRIYQCSGSVSTDEVLGTVRAYAADPGCGGIIVQLPLPPQVNRTEVLAALPLEKDVDAIGAAAVRAEKTGASRILPPAVGVVEKILTTHNLQPTTLSAAVLGAKGFLVGVPVSDWLEGKVASLAHIDIGDDHSPIKNADLIVSATGQSGILKPAELKNGAVVIDFGYSKKVDGNIIGDLDTSPTQSPNLQHIQFTPTPGGTGPILVAQLFENFYTLNR